MNFLKPEAENMGGLVFFCFLPVEEIISFTKTSDFRVSSIILKSGSDMYAGYSSPGTLIFQATPVESEQGTTYDILVKGFYPRPGYQMLEIFSEMVNGKYVVIVKDNNSASRIAGNITEPLSFRFSEASAQRAQEMPGVEFQFYGKVTKPPLFYTSSIDFPSLEAPETDPGA